MINLDGDNYLEPAEAVEVLACLERLNAYGLLYWMVEPDRTLPASQPRLVHFYVLTNDVFWWGTADSEEVTVADLPELERAYKDAGARWAGALYVARKRQLRPQGCAYPTEEHLIALFDACGPKRGVDFMNPYTHPEDGRQYAYEEPPSARSSSC